MNRCGWWIGLTGIALAWTSAAGATPEKQPWDGLPFSADPAEVARAVAGLPAPNAEIEVLFQDTLMRLDDRGLSRRTVRRVYRCLNQSGVGKARALKVFWRATYDERPSVRVRVITPDGREHLFDPHFATEIPVPQDSRSPEVELKSLLAPLPALCPGAVVEEEVVVDEVTPYCDHGMLQHVVCQGSNPISRQRVTVDAPTGLTLHYRARGVSVQPTRQEREGRVVLVFDVGPQAAYQPPEPYMPAELPIVSEIVFSNGKSWADAAAGYAAIVDRQTDSAAVARIVREEIRDEQDRQRIITRLLTTLQRLAWNSGINRHGSAIVPHSVRQTLSRQFGDCKDQATLLISMLRAAGIPAQPALLRVSRPDDLIPDLPALNTFDHVIVYVPGSPELWIDSTAPFVRMGQLPLRDQGRWALIVAPVNGRLVQTPKADYHEHTRSDLCEFWLAADGHARVQLVSRFTGGLDERARNHYGSTREGADRGWWQDFGWQYQGLTPTRLDYVTLKDRTRPFELHVDLSDVPLGRVAGERIVLPFSMAPLMSELPDLFNLRLGKNDEGLRGFAPLLRQRRSPLALPLPHLRQMQYRIVPPLGYAVAKLPEAAAMQLGPFRFSRRFQIVGKLVVATFNLDTAAETLSPEELASMGQRLERWIAERNTSGWQAELVFQRGDR
jgi:transglutaminase-like putative cysteine protease